MTKKKTNPIKKQPIPEDFELSDEEPVCCQSERGTKTDS